MNWQAMTKLERYYARFGVLEAYLKRMGYFHRMMLLEIKGWK